MLFSTNAWAEFFIPTIQTDWQSWAGPRGAAGWPLPRIFLGETVKS